MKMRKHNVARIIALEVMSDFRAACFQTSPPSPRADYSIRIVSTPDKKCTGYCCHETQCIEVIERENDYPFSTLVHELTHSYQGIPSRIEWAKIVEVQYDRRPREREAWAVAWLTMIRLHFGRECYQKILSVKFWAWRADEIFTALRLGTRLNFAGRGLRKVLAKYSKGDLK
jgi:hypothetical protein